MFGWQHTLGSQPGFTINFQAQMENENRKEQLYMLILESREKRLPRRVSGPFVQPGQGTWAEVLWRPGGCRGG